MNADGIKITVLECGTMSVPPYFADIRRRRGFSGRVEMPVNAYLIEHPVHGRILVDTGWSADVQSRLPQHLLQLYRPHIAPGQTAKEQLAAMGLAPEDIDLVLLTHLDIDHCCALSDFAGRAKRIVCGELEYFYSCRLVYKLRQHWDSWVPYIPEKDRIHFRASVLGPCGRGFDLFGDESVLCIYCPGHTDGSFAVIIGRGPSNRFKDQGAGKYGGKFAVLAADIAFSQENIDGDFVPGYGFDRQMQAKSLHFLAGLQRDPMHTVTLFSHSRSAARVTVL